MGVSINGGTPKWMVYDGKSYKHRSSSIPIGVPGEWLHPRFEACVEPCALQSGCILSRHGTQCRDVLRDCVSLAEFNLLAGLWFHFFFKVTRIMGHEDFPTFWTTFLFFEAMKSADLPLGQAISSWWTQRRTGFKSSTKMTMAGTRPLRENGRPSGRWDGLSFFWSWLMKITTVQYIMATNTATIMASHKLFWFLDSFPIL